MRRAAILALLPALFLFFPSNFALQAQAVSPLWGDLVPGQHRVGFRVMKLRDATRSFNRTAERIADRGYPPGSRPLPRRPQPQNNERLP